MMMGAALQDMAVRPAPMQCLIRQSVINAQSPLTNAFFRQACTGAAAPAI